MNRNTTLTRAFGIAFLCTAVTGFADDGAGHQAVQPRPVQLGTSGGNVNDISFLYCCSGTLGGLVQDSSGNQYILSNNHVLGGSNLAVVGDPVNQPGMIDQNCQPDGVVAHFSALVPLQFTKGRKIKWNRADAAIAQVVNGAVSTDGSILDIGGLSGGTLSAAPGMSVQKSGRTTGHTTGTVLAVDVTTAVGYAKECGGSANQTAYFDGQIRIGGASFSAGGDSGSIVVESVGTDPSNGLPRAVGLLFAGDSTSTLANPIADVLSLLGVSMVEGIVIPPGPMGTLTGTVVDAESGAGIDGAKVSVQLSGVEVYSTFTGLDGTYAMSAETGTYDVVASASGYDSATTNGVTVVEDATTTADFALAPASAPWLATPACVGFDTSGGRNGDKNLQFSVTVTDDFGTPISGAVVDISVMRDGAAFGTGSGASTNGNGVVTYQARNAPNGTYVITVTDIQAAGLTFSGPATTPANSFVKGTDAVPASFCADESPTNSTALPNTLSRARAAKARASASLMALNGVVGHGVATSDSGAVVEVYVLKSAGRPAHAAIPQALEGIPVRIVETDGFLAY